MEGPITVTLLVQDNRISCLETTQEGESQSRGGYEAIRDGKFATMIEAAQGADIDAVSGATITTAGVKQAVEDALSQAEAAAAGATARAREERRDEREHEEGRAGPHPARLPCRGGGRPGRHGGSCGRAGAAFAVQEGFIGDWAADGSKDVSVPPSAATNASWSDGTYREHNGAAFPADDASPSRRARFPLRGTTSATSAWWARAVAG